MDDSENKRLLNDEGTFQGNLTMPHNLGYRASETLPVNSRQWNNATAPYVPQGCSNYEDDIISHESDMDSDSIKGAPTAGKPSLKVYKRRWIIMGIFCLLCVMENIVWNTWGPIAITAENYFHWGNDDIAQLNNWGNINVLLFILPAVWLLESKGVRVTVIVATFLLFLSTGVRCITFKHPYALWMMNAGQFLNGISIIITLITPAILSTLWFPLKERVTAVSIISLACNLGTTLSFLVGMSLTDIGLANSTHHHHSHNSSNPLTKMAKINHTASTRERDGKDIRMIMYSEFGVSVLIFIAILCYFPNRPKLPPSKSASFSRPKPSVGLKELVRNRNIWLLCLSTGLTYGIIGNFIGLLALVLKPLNVNQRQAQFMGMYGQLVAIFLPVAVGKIADRLNKSLKLILGFFWLVVVASSIALLLIALKVIANYIALIYFLTIVICGFLAICYPLSWQLGCEITYPASEGLTLGLMYFFQNIVGTVFLLLFKIPNIGTVWVLYCCAGSSVIGFLLFIFIKVEYRRLHVDSTSILESNDSYGAINT